MSKYGLSKDMVKAICKVCGQVGFHIEPETKKCDKCGHGFGKKVKSYIDGIPNASSETHDRYSWFCGSCEHRGLKWIERGSSFKSCPVCSNTFRDKMCVLTDPLRGRCKDIWGVVEQIVTSLPKPSLKNSLIQGNCYTCGHEYSYRVMPPFRCDNCGENGRNFRIPSEIRPSLGNKKQKSLDCAYCGFKHFLPSPQICSGCGRPLGEAVEVQS
jgi:ribosomal protein L37E